MEPINQGRLWALRNKGSKVIMHDMQTNLPTLFRQRKGVDTFISTCEKHGLEGIEAVEVIIIEK